MKLNVGVVFGGRSVEHEISIISANLTMNAINKDRYNVIPFYIDKNGGWYTGDSLFELNNYRDIDKLLLKTQGVIPKVGSGASGFYKVPKNIFTSRKLINVDVIFPVIHGTYGEDGILQGLFESMNIPYVGCDVLSSAVAMDKVTSKVLLQSAGINILDYHWFYGEQWVDSKDDVISNIKSKFDYPLVVKPANLGSSIGVAAVNDDSELEDAIDLSTRLSHRVLIEPKIKNLKEINCSVLGDRELIEVSVCEEPLGVDDILSYRDKYSGGSKNKLGFKSSDQGAKRKIPADISEDLNNKIQEMAKRAFTEFACSGVVRVDFLIDQDSNDVYLCELNTIPGSLSFYLWEPSGKDFPSLTERLIEIALKRNREDNNLLVTYSENILKAGG